jgi:hypothetical protein
MLGRKSPQLRRLDTDFSPRSPWFNPVWLHVIFVVDELGPKHIFLTSTILQHFISSESAFVNGSNKVFFIVSSHNYTSLAISSLPLLGIIAPRFRFPAIITTVTGTCQLIHWQWVCEVVLLGVAHNRRLKLQYLVTAQEIQIRTNSIACYAVHETATRKDQCDLVRNTSEHAQCVSSPNADKMQRILDVHMQQWSDLNQSSVFQAHPITILISWPNLFFNS